jgi:hypothetical protein
MHHSVDRDEAGEGLCGFSRGRWFGELLDPKQLFGARVWGRQEEGSGEFLVFGGQAVGAAFQCFGGGHRVRRKHPLQ